MSNSEDSGSKCSPAPISSFTIQSILGTPSESARSAGKESCKPPQPRKRTLSVSSEEECSGGEDCFCSDPGLPETCNRHQPLSFPCLGMQSILFVISYNVIIITLLVCCNQATKMQAMLYHQLPHLPFSKVKSQLWVCGLDYFRLAIAYPTAFCPNWIKLQSVLMCHINASAANR